MMLYKSALQNVLKRMVRRMTRFIVKVSITKIGDEIEAVCMQKGLQVKRIDQNQVHLVVVCFVNYCNVYM